MFKLSLLAVILFCIGLSTAVRAQDISQRTQELVAALDKTKYKKKEKKNISIEIYIDVRNEPVVKNNPGEYSGVYLSEESGYRLDIQVAANGSVTGDGYDTANWQNSDRANFTLKDARIEGALLTGTKVFDNGTSEKLEALFTNRTISSGKNPNEISNRDTSFGIGFIQTNGSSTNRVFLERR
jgi:hypothetical protein